MYMTEVKTITSVEGGPCASLDNPCTVFSVYDDAAKRRARRRARKIQEETTTGGNDGSEWRVDGEVIKRKPTLRQSSWE